MSSFDRQLESFVRSGMTDQEIADALELDVGNVCVVTEKFRRKLERDQKFSSEGRCRDIQEKAIRVMEELLESDNEVVKFRAAQYINDEATGRNERRVSGDQRAVLGILRDFALEVMENNKLASAQKQKALTAGPEIIEAEVLVS